MVRIRFEFRLTPRDSISPASILVDPAEGWALQEYEGMFGTKHDHPRRGRVEYADGPGGVRLPRRVVFEHSTSCWTFDLDLISTGERPDPSRFLLASYGLPEPPGSQSGWPLAYGLTAIGLVGLIGAMVLRGRARRLGGAAG